MPNIAAHRRRGDAVLARAGLGDHALLAHAPREQDLADAVVDLVRAGVAEVLALEVDPAAAELRASSARRNTAASAGRRIRGGSSSSSRRNAGRAARASYSRASSLQRRHQRLGHEHAAVRAEMAERIGIGVLMATFSALLR